MANAPKKNQIRNKDLEDYAGNKTTKSGAGKTLKSGKKSKGRDKKISNYIKQDSRKGDAGMKNPRRGNKGNLPGGDRLAQQLNAGVGGSPDLSMQVLSQILGQGGPTGPVAGPSPQLQQQVLQQMGMGGPSPAAMEMFVERYGREPANEQDMIILQNIANEIGE